MSSDIVKKGLGKRMAKAAPSTEQLVDYFWVEEAEDYAERLARGEETKGHAFELLAELWNAIADAEMDPETYVRHEFKEYFHDEK